MRTREKALYGGLVVVVLATLAYLPVVVAWMQRDSDPPMVRFGPPEPSPTFTLVTMNWCMQQAPSIYQPLLKLHARMCGWDPTPTPVGDDESQYIIFVFQKRGTNPSSPD